MKVMKNHKYLIKLHNKTKVNTKRNKQNNLLKAQLFRKNLYFMTVQLWNLNFMKKIKSYRLEIIFLNSQYTFFSFLFNIKELIL